VIVLTHGYFLEDDEKEQLIMRPYVPLGILYLAAYLDTKGIENTVIDTTFSSFENFKSQLLRIKPPLIGIYTNLMTKQSVLRTINFIKQAPELQNCRVILGGPEIRYNAANYLHNGADFLVIGEGEETFYEICDSFLRTGHVDLTIHGLAYLEKEAPVFTPERALVRDINSLPPPARHKIKLELYGNAWKQRHGYSMYSISTMRGCPYTCKWCSRAVYGGTYRRRSAKLVADEMEYLETHYQPDRLWFVDDVFTINHKWLREFRDEVLKRKIKIPYEIITRADRMNDEVIAILKETGCFRVWIGAESGSQKIIDAMDRRVDVRMVRENIIKAKRMGIEAGTFIMLGYPGEERADIKETIQHLKASDPSFYTITVAYPITGTPLYEEVNGDLRAPGAWETITDRDYDFKRVHSRSYYKHAVDWVNHEVSFHKAGTLLNKLKYKSKSLLAQVRMLVS
jgi:radical SAM superfamily enzyme YgiQ (UPF0313 family)